VERPANWILTLWHKMIAVTRKDSEDKGGWLVLTREAGQLIDILVEARKVVGPGLPIIIKVMKVSGSRVRIGIKADKTQTIISRREVTESICSNHELVYGKGGATDDR